MSIIKGLRAATARSPTVSKSVTVGSLTASGGLAAGEDPQSAARKLSAVDRCIELLSDSIAKMPNYVIDTRTRERTDHELLRLLNIRPNEAMTPFIRKKVLETSRLEGGNGYDWIVRDERTGKPVELIPVPWYLVQPWHDMAGRVWYDVTHPFSGKVMRLPNEDVCHYKNATRNGLLGLGTVTRAGEVIAAARAAQEYELSYYANGGQPGGVLETDTDLGGYVLDTKGNPVKAADGSLVTKKDRLRAEWERVHMGPSKAHRTAILDLGLKYTSIAGTNRDAQFVENKQLSITDIARYFGVPLYKLNEGKQAYGSNEQNAIEYVVGTLHPIVTQYEEEQSYKLLADSELAAGLELRINMMAELKGDTASRANWYRTMSELSVFSPDDIAALEEKAEALGPEINKAARDYEKLAALMKEKEETEALLEEKMERWIYLNDLAEQISNQ